MTDWLLVFKGFYAWRCSDFFPPKDVGNFPSTIKLGKVPEHDQEPSVLDICGGKEIRSPVDIRTLALDYILSLES